MALISLSLQAVYDTAGFRATAARLFVYGAGTTTPAQVYADPTYATPLPFPVLLRGNGTWPVMYAPAGSYRLRVTDPDDNILDEVGFYRVEPEGSDAPDTSIDDRRLAQTGDIKDRYGIGKHAGWVPCNGRTIGSSASSASERANDDCQALFIFLWTQDRNLAVSGGRGLNAAADWNSAKAIALPDMRGRARIALDDLGSVAAGRLSGGLFAFGNAVTLGAYGGEASHVQSLAEMASHDHVATATMGAAGLHAHTGTTSSDGSHFHDVPYRQEVGYTTGGGSSFPGVTSVGVAAASPNFTGYTGAVSSHSHTYTTSTDGSHTHSLTVAVAARGASAAMSWLPPFILVSTYIKL